MNIEHANIWMTIFRSLVFSRVLRDSTPHFVSPSVGPSVFGLTAPAKIIKWPQIQPLPTRTRLGLPCIRSCYFTNLSVLGDSSFEDVMAADPPSASDGVGRGRGGRIIAGHAATGFGSSTMRGPTLPLGRGRAMELLNQCWIYTRTLFMTHWN